MPKLILVLLLCSPCLLRAAEYLENAGGEVYQTAGTASEIFSKAKICVAREIRDHKDGQALLDSSQEEGIITANNAVKYGKIVARTVRSTMTILVKDARFKINHNNIEYSIAGGAYQRVGKWAGAGSQEAEKNLLAASERLAACIQDQSKKEDW